MAATGVIVVMRNGWSFCLSAKLEVSNPQAGVVSGKAFGNGFDTTCDTAVIPQRLRQTLKGVTKDGVGVGVKREPENPKGTECMGQNQYPCPCPAHRQQAPEVAGMSG